MVTAVLIVLAGLGRAEAQTLGLDFVSVTPGPATYTAIGQSIGYTYVLKNTGNVPLTTPSLTGSKTGDITCPSVNFSPGATATCTSTYVIASADFCANISYTVTAFAYRTISRTVTLSASAQASGTIACSARRSLTVTANPSPTTFSSAGEVIAYTFTVANTGDVPLSALSLSGTKIGAPVSCRAQSLAIGGTTTCSSSYTTISTDVGSPIAFSVVASASYANGATLVTNSASGTIGFVNSQLALAQNASRGINNFLVRRADVVTGMQPDTERQHARLSGCVLGTCADDDAPAPGAGFSGAGGGRSASLAGESGLGGGGGDDDRRRPSLSGRGEADGEPSSGPASPGRSARSPAAMSTLGFSGQTENGNSRYAFSTSLDQIRREAQQAQAAAPDSQPNAGTAKPSGPTAALGYRDGGGLASVRKPAAFDVWAQGNWASYEDKRGGNKIGGDGGMLSFGADYRVSPAILVGVMASIDRIVDRDLTKLGAGAGQGWMYGPYVSARLTRNVFLDIRGAWGQSDNTVDSTGSGVNDSYTTDRSLYSAKLTGVWAWGRFRLRPSAEILHYEERQKSFLTQLGVLVGEQTVRLGRVTFGPEISYRVIQADASTFEPFLGLKGVWDFDKTKSVNLADGTPSGSDDFRGWVEGGVTFRSLRGVSVRASVSYDGIGSDSFHAVREQVTISIPLN